MNLNLEQQQHNFLFSQMENTTTESLTDQPDESIVIPLIEVPCVKISQPGVSNDFLAIKTNYIMDPGLAIQQTGATTRNTWKKTGIAFSGGGIRSAAFCSGALRRMLQDNVPLEYLSCVSGGGFTGGAFMDWKYRQETNKWNNKKKWHNEFFEHMRANAGYLCSWQNPILGIFQSILLTLVVLFVACILPCTLWLPYALPVAAAVDFLFGEILRENCTSSHGMQQDTSTTVVMMDLYNGCQPSVDQMLLFTITATVSLACYVLSRRGNLMKYRGPLKLLSTLSGLVFAFTAFPWIAHDILWPSKIWVRFLIFFISLVFPFFFPVIRKSAGLCLRSYVYTYVLSWKVFKVKLIGKVEYSDDIFYPVLMVCALLFMFFPVVRSLQQSLFNVYYRFVLNQTQDIQLNSQAK